MNLCCVLHGTYYFKQLTKINFNGNLIQIFALEYTKLDKK